MTRTRDAVTLWGLLLWIGVLLFVVAHVVFNKDLRMYYGGRQLADKTPRHHHLRESPWFEPRYDRSTDVPLPKWTHALVDLWEPIGGTPLFWNLSGGTTVSCVLRRCLGLTLSTNHSMLGAANDSDDVILTEHMPMLLLNEARAFVMMRHPVKRAIDMHHGLEEDNIVVRSLVNSNSSNVTELDVALAKNVLRRKFLVGLMEWFDVSLVRMERYFGWWDDNETVNHCHHVVMQEKDKNKDHPSTLESSLLAARNWADMELYRYAKTTLFAQQAKLPQLLTKAATT